jgi:hypothetical protein
MKQTRLTEEQIIRSWGCFGLGGESVRFDVSIVFSRQSAPASFGQLPPLPAYRIHRVLEREGVESYIVDPATIGGAAREGTAFNYLSVLP